MCKVIAIVNQKGGVAKTTTTVNLGIGLVREGKKVLLIDADSQGSLSSSLGVEEPDELDVTLSTIMGKVINEEDYGKREGVIVHEEGVSFLPCNIELSGLEVTLVNTMRREYILKEYITSVRNLYDYILIDCNSSLGMVTMNALTAADSVIIPIEAAYLSIKGLRIMNRECNNRVRNGQYRVWGVPKNIYNLGMIFSAFCLDTMLPKGTVLEEVGTMLARGAWELDDKGNKVPKVGKNGQVLKTKSGKVIYKRTPYKIKVFNTINFAKSMHYNPFAYIHTEQDVLKFVNTLIANTKGEGAQSGEDFWVKAERLLFTAYVAYIVKYCKKSERNFVSLLAMIDASETREEDEDFENAIDLMFKDIEFGNDEEGIEADPDSFAVRQYHKYKLAAGVIR